MPPAHQESPISAGAAADAIPEIPTDSPAQGAMVHPQQSGEIVVSIDAPAAGPGRPPAPPVPPASKLRPHVETGGADGGGAKDCMSPASSTAEMVLPNTTLNLSSSSGMLESPKSSKGDAGAGAASPGMKSASAAEKQRLGGLVDHDSGALSPHRMSPVRDGKRGAGGGRRMVAAWGGSAGGLLSPSHRGAPPNIRGRNLAVSKGESSAALVDNGGGVGDANGGGALKGAARMDAYRTTPSEASTHGEIPNLFDESVLAGVGAAARAKQLTTIVLALIAVCLVICAVVLGGGAAEKDTRVSKAALRAYFTERTFEGSAVVGNASAAAAATVYTLEEIHAIIDDYDNTRGDLWVAGVVLLAVAVVLMVVAMAGQVKTGQEVKGALAATEQDRALLTELLPPAIVSAIHAGDGNLAMWHPELTFVFTDVAGFTKLTATATPDMLVSVLNKVFHIFDTTAMEFGIFKVKTMGDAFMGVAGLGNRIDDEMHHIVASVEGETTLLNIRIGLSVGACVSGVLGAIKPAYDFWGKTVNMASRMESAGKPGRINCSPVAHATLVEVSHYEFEVQSGIFIKGEGKMDTFLVKDTEERRRMSQRLLKRASMSSGMAVEKAGQNQALQQLAAIQSAENFQTDVRHVLHAMALLSEELELDKAMNTVVSAVKELLSCDRATLFLVDEKRQELWSYNRVEQLDGANKVRAKIRIPIDTGVAGAAATSGQIVNIKDAYSDPRFNSKVDIQTGYRTQSLLALPVKRGEKVVAVVQAVNKAVGSFTLQDEFLISLLGRQLAIQLKHTTLFEKIKAAKERQLTLKSISQDMNSLSLEDMTARSMVDAVTTGAMQLVDCDAAVLFVVLPDGENMYALLPLSAADGGDAPESTVCARVGHGVVGHVAETKQVLVVQDVAESALYDPLVDGAVGPCKSLLAVPVHLADAVAGVLLVATMVLPDGMSFAASAAGSPAMGSAPAPACPAGGVSGHSSSGNPVLAGGDAANPDPVALGPQQPSPKKLSQVPFQAVREGDPGFTDDDVAILESYSTFVGLTLRGLTLWDLQQRQHGLLEFVFDVAARHAGGALEDRVAAIETQLPGVFGCEACRVLLRSPGDGDGDGATLVHLNPPRTAWATLPAPPGACGVAGGIAIGARTAPCRTNSFTTDPAYCASHDNTLSVSDASAATALVVPVVAAGGGRVLGALQLVGKDPDAGRTLAAAAAEGFTEDDQALLGRLAAVVARHVE